MAEAGGTVAQAMKMPALMLMMMVFQLLPVVGEAAATGMAPRRKRSTAKRMMPVLLEVAVMDATGPTV